MDAHQVNGFVLVYNEKVILNILKLKGKYLLLDKINRKSGFIL